MIGTGLGRVSRNQQILFKYRIAEWGDGKQLSRAFMQLLRQKESIYHGVGHRW